MYSILIADDDYYQSSRYMNTDIWNKYGFELASAVQTEKQVLDFLSKNKTDLVLTEVSRPQINGVRLAEEILREHRDTCVVFSVRGLILKRQGRGCGWVYLTI